MYYFSWSEPPLPGPGSYATHPAHEVFEYVFTVLTSIDLVLQAYIFFLMLRVATAQLHEYRYFMMLSTTWDICFATTVGFVMKPRVHGPLFPCVSARGPASAFGNEGARISIVLVYTFGTALIASQVYSMSYRVTAVVRDQALKRRFISWPVTGFNLLLQAAVAAAIGYATHLMTIRDSDDLYDGRELASERSLNEAGEWVWKERDLWYALLGKMNNTEYLTEEDTSIMCINVLDWTTHYLQAAIMVLLLITELCSCTAAVWIIRQVRKLSSQSPHARQMHLQLTRLLLSQMLCPVICMLGPVVYLTVGTTKLFDTSLVGFYMCLVVISVFPIFNAILTIAFVGPYRRFTVGWIEGGV